MSSLQPVVVDDETSCIMSDTLHMVRSSCSTLPNHPGYELHCVSLLVSVQFQSSYPYIDKYVM
jgi:hypothetical protein